MKLALITTAFSVPLSLILIPSFGIIGLIFTNLVAGIPSLVTGVWWIKKHFGFTVDWFASAKILFASISASVPTYIIISLINSCDWIELFIGGTVFLAAYLITTPIVGAVDRRDIKNLRQTSIDLGPFTVPLNLLLGIIEKLTPPSQNASP